MKSVRNRAGLRDDLKERTGYPIKLRKIAIQQNLPRTNQVRLSNVLG